MGVSSKLFVCCLSVCPSVFITRCTSTWFIRLMLLFLNIIFIWGRNQVVKADKLNHRCTQGTGEGGWGVWGGIKLYPPSKIFAKLVNKNAMKHQNGVPSPQTFHNPYTPSLPKFVKNLTEPPLGFSNHVHLWIKSKLCPLTSWLMSM